MGYGTMGFAAGVVIAARSGSEHPVVVSALSALSFSGTLQFVIGDWLRDGLSMSLIALMTLAISFRYALYGFSLIERWRGVGLLKKLFLIGGLADENYALETSCRLGDRRDFVLYCLVLTSLDLFYWFAGCVAGAVAGESLPIPDRGIEFVMAALFLTILTDQVRDLAKGARR